MIYVVYTLYYILSSYIQCVRKTTATIMGELSESEWINVHG